MWPLLSLLCYIYYPLSRWAWAWWKLGALTNRRHYFSETCWKRFICYLKVTLITDGDNVPQRLFRRLAQLLLLSNDLWKRLNTTCVLGLKTASLFFPDREPCIGYWQLRSGKSFCFFLFNPSVHYRNCGCSTRLPKVLQALTCSLHERPYIQDSLKAGATELCLENL